MLAKSTIRKLNIRNLFVEHAMQEITSYTIFYYLKIKSIFIGVNIEL